MTPCQDCTCGRGQGRNCKLRQPRELTRREWVCGLLLCGAMIVAALLTGCQRDDVRAQISASEPQPVFVYRDQDTGCEYVAASSGGAITPRIAADGISQVGCRQGAKP